MTVSKSLEEIWRIKDAGMSHEEIIWYIRERRPPDVGPPRRFEKPEAARSRSEIDHS